MCNLYKLTAPAQAIARMFDVEAADRANVGEEVYPGYPGMVIAEGTCRTMSWGFPLVPKSKKTGQPLRPKSVNNAREDKLHTSFWRDSFAKRRCLIPVSAWAEAEGAKGRMTRTWYSLPSEDLFAVAGIWRPTDEWGDAYSMVMVDGCEQMSDVHDRMPTILRRDDWARWTEGAPEEAFALCRIWNGPLAVDRTAEGWRR
ncbi:SOS response-associated peptidase [Novosphingobium album (ex Hu et al. 2023)]|uniref:Abasic site processing protein n=1 Tax=Novosphingobium album (ex Hu et al. 2023) TaxID=2930093 RepID=A0ABT0B7K7_9SPHN|nr:SOS response-associated peptidase family protein [Novosphingobium album (ex Hu et al. 2023)]MCJ2180809.1 SOS response-associated peptidase [Novosphingobium album (ex Hu et al. 2023)]